MVREIKEIEIARLDLRYGCTRIERPKESLALAAAIDRVGQIVPVIVTNDHRPPRRLLRVKALTHLGRDTVWRRSGTVRRKTALVEVLARAHNRKWDVSRRRPFLRNSMIVAISLKEGSRRWRGADPGLGVFQARSLQCPLRGYYGLIRKGVGLDVDGDEGDRPHCARDTGARNQPSGNLSCDIPFHEGDGPVLSALPKSHPQAERRRHGGRPGCSSSSPSMHGRKPWRQKR